jgi:Mrp family chromosome partitioning ATPase
VLLVGVLAVLGAVAVAGVAKEMAPQYAATANFQALQVSLVGSTATSGVAILDQLAVQQATTVPVLTVAARQLGMTETSLAADISASLATDGSDVVYIKATASTPAQAIAEANSDLSAVLASNGGSYGQGQTAVAAPRVGLSTKKGGLLGLLAGLVLGAVAVVLWELRHHRTRSAAGVSALLGGADVVPLPQNRLAASTQLRLLAVELDLELDRHQGAIVGVIAPGPDADVVAVAQELATAMATPGRRVAVLVCDGGERLHDLPAVATDGSVHGVGSAVAGSPLLLRPPVSPELLGPEEARAMVEGLRRRADVVLVVACDLVGRPASLRMLASAVGAVMVVARHDSSAGATHDAAAALATAGCPVLATLLVHTDHRRLRRLRADARRGAALPGDPDGLLLRSAEGHVAVQAAVPETDREPLTAGAGPADPDGARPTPNGSQSRRSRLDYTPDLSLAISPEDFQFAPPQAGQPDPRP